MPDWLVPAAGVIGTGLGAILTALFNAKGAAYAQLNALVDQLQEDRDADRKLLAGYASKVDVALEHLQIERDYSSELLSWGLNGAPPPPPTRRTPAPAK